MEHFSTQKCPQPILFTARDEHLPAGNAVQDVFLPLRIELGQHVVEQQQRCAGCDLAVNLPLGEGDTLFIEKLPVEAGDAVTFDQVLAIVDGENTKFGTPVVEGAKVEATVVKNGKGKKVRVYKYKAKKGYHKRQGHRQPYTKVEIGKISV